MIGTPKIEGGATDAQQSATPPLSEALDEWTNYLGVQRGQDERALRRAHGQISRLAAFNGWGVIAEFNAEGVRSFIEHLKREPGRSGKGTAARTLQNYASCARSFTNWAHEQGYIPTDPLVKFRVREKGSGKGSRTLSLHEAHKLIRGSLERWVQHGQSYQPRWIFQLLLLYTAARESEALALTFAQLKYDEQAIFIPAWASKNGHARTIYFHPELQEALKWWREQRKGKDTDPIVGDLITQGDFKGLRRDCEHAGVNPKRVGHHSFRKCAATALKGAQMHGGDLASVASQTGHRSQKVLESVYIDDELLPTAELYARLPVVFPNGARNTIEHALKHKSLPVIAATETPRELLADPRLDRVSSVWSTLPEPIRCAIDAMVSSVHEQP